MRRLPLCLRLLPSLLLLFAPATRLRAEGIQHWLEVKTEHFTVYCDGSERQARTVSAQLERMHDLFAKLLPHATEDAGSRIVVLALKNRRDFQGVEPVEYLGKGSLDLAGYFLQTPDQSFIALRLDGEGEHPYGVLYHEYTHYMLRHAVTIPVWLNEGLAQFYENTDLGDKTARFGQPSANELIYLRQQRLIPLPTLFAVDHNSPFYHEQDKGNVFYAESWALTHMLFLRDFQRHTMNLSAYVSDVAKGDDPVTAAAKAFGDLKQLQHDLDAYVNGGSFHALLMPMQNAVNDASFKVEPIPTPTADAVRADLLINEGRLEDGKTLIDDVLRATPAIAQVHETLGLFALRQGDLRTARKEYGEAVKLHSTSYLAYYYFGSLSMQLGKTEEITPTGEAIGASLQEAVRLNPGFAPALDVLAHYDAEHDQLVEASQLELRAVGADPSNIGYRLNAAQIRVQRKEYDAAIRVLKTALPLAQTAEDRRQVQERLNSMQRLVAQQKEQEGQASQTQESTVTTLTGTARPADRASTESTPPYVTDGQGHRVGAGRAVEPPPLPPGPPNGPHHVVRGSLQQISCFYPKGLLLRVQGPGKPVALYSNDMYGIAMTVSNFTPKKEMNPCVDFDGLKASVVYGAIDDPAVAGQIISIELSR